MGDQSPRKNATACDIGKVAGAGGTNRRLLEDLLKPMSGNHGIGYKIDSIG